MANGSAEQQPIAAIGMSCRLPLASTPDQLWRLLNAGADAITEAPGSRWPPTSRDEYHRGGFIADVDLFDADCFGISPNEADAMDPQQRLALELSWEAFEHARIATSELRGTATGVFIGAINDDYAALHDRLDAEAPSSYAFTGTQRSLTANRISYLFGLQGPSMTIDAGQSSSLLAVQLACEGLRRGDVELALAGGVNLNLLPETSAAIAGFGALSPDGRCYTFDSRANGYVRGEGGALVVLKPLAAALADGDPVHCVILGGAVNNDGGGDGLTVPSGRAQQEVIRLACRRAGVEATEVQYVELHGTGTRVGDPIEAAALSGALAGNRRVDAPLLVGSVKTNIGHLEGAAGVAGLLKVILNIVHRGLTPSLNFEVPNPAIDMAGLRLEVVTAAREWPRPDHRLVAGVSSFGLGGTNCHLVLAEPPRQVAAERAADPGQGAPWILTARSAPALRAQAGRLSEHLGERDSFEAADVAFSLARTRARFEHRAVLLGTGRDELLAGLDALAAGRAGRSVLLGRAVPGTCALVFPGQGSQWQGMARDLLAESPVFRERLSECAEALAPFIDYSLLDVLRSAPGVPDLSRVDVVQPALWAVMVSLAELWRSEGLRADMVIGHSQGEIAAATVVGALSVTDAARVVALRSRAIRRIAGGGMMSIGASVDDVVKRLAGMPGLTIAAVNGPRSVVVSGAAAALVDLHQELQAAGCRSKILPVQYASHSAAVDGLRAELLTQLAPVTPRATDTLFISTLTGQPMDTTGLDPEYWFQSLRQPIRFADATRQALALDCGLFIECSPHPVLVGSMSETVDDSGREATVIGTLHRDADGPDEFRRSVAEAFVGGADIDWNTRCDVPGARLTDLPTYAFQRERHWLDAPSRRRAGQQDVARPAVAEPVPAGMSRHAVQDLVTGAAAAVLGYAGNRAVDPSRTFKDLGLDSAGAVEVCARLRSLTGLRLPSTLTFDFPTPARLAGHVHAELTGTGTGTAAGGSPGGSPPAPADDPIAIVAMGCRFPGDVASPEDLWRLVSTGGDAISELPVNRGWDLDALFGGPEQPGSCATRYGGFLHDADTFDAAFFGLSPREALGMDPQQRLLLETSWETIERAGIDPADLAGTPTGVFVGAMSTDYGPRLHQPTGAADGHLLTGTALSVASGRIAYTFGLQGPALTVDTACSSSLVAIQLASSALRRGECSLALAGGVTVMSNPGNLVEFTRQNGLAVDGRAKAFSAAADGTSFAEGAGMLLLERLCDARENGHPVLALIAGGAVNSDGASNGLTAPNGQAQQQVIRQALASAGLDPAQVDAVEAHGTGTALGDPIEANAIVATYGRNRPAGQPLWLGSVKSNIGHTQAAAGVAGVIKMVLAMRHGVLPRTLHADEPTAAVDWAGGQVRLLTQQQDWVCPDRPRRAAVSGFGISGTNAHLILQAAPAPGAGEPAGAPPTELRPLVWMLSARTAGSLRAQAGRLRSYAASAPELDLAAAGPRLAGRPSFAPRAAVVAADRDELCAALAALADGGTHPRASTGHGAGDPQPVFVFPGQGGQWAGMARDLLAADETFAAQLRRCDEALRPHTGWSVHDVLTGADGAPALEGSGVIQPVLFAVMVSLAEMWRSAGIEPAAVVGHSQGEIAAACVSGALSLADAAKVAALRSQVLATLDGTGGMISVSLPVADVLGKIAPWPDQLWVAADNGPSSTVVAGDPDAMAQFTSRWQDTVQLRRIALDYASHCPHVEKVHDDVLARIGELAPRDTPTAICSSSIGDFIPGSALGTEYWYFNLAEQVRFDTAIRAFQDYDKPLFIEVSPHPVLAGAIAEILSDAGIDGAAIGTLHRGAGARTDFLASVAKAWVRGAAVSWPAILGARGRDVGPDRNLDLPAYAFDRQRYWLTGADRGPAVGALGHPLLAAVQPMADSDGFLLTGRISRSAVPWLADHTVGGAVLLPGTAFVELALQAAAASGAGAVDELTVQAPLVLPEIGAVDVQVTAGGPDAAGFRTLAIHSRAAGAVDADWIRHASGTLAAGDEPANRDSLAAWPPAGATPIDLTDAYDRLAEAGYEYGPAFQGLLAAWRSGTDSYAEVRLPEPVTAGARSFAMHPALLDAALHILVLDAAADADGGLLLPFSWSGIRVSAAGADRIRVRLSESADGGVALAIYDGTGRPVARVDSLTMRRAPAGGSLAAPAGSSAGLYDLNWIAAPVPTLSAAQLADRQWAVVGTDPRAKDVCDALQSDGINAPLYYELASVADQVAGAVPAVVVLPYLPDVQDEADDPGYAVHEGLRQLLDVVQQWVSDERFADSRLVLVADRDSLAGAPMWGLVRSAATEHPGRFVLADVGEAAGSWGLLAAAIAAGEPQCAVRDGQVLVPRLARRTSEAAGHAAELGSGTVLVTGGTSGLGAVVAAHLVARHGVRDLLLTSRRGSAAPGAGELAERLEALGASVRIAACDVSDRRALTRLLKSVQLTGVVHAAGVLDDATVEGLSPDQLDAALHPKVDAGLLLHELTAGMPLSAFVLFSSIAGVLGNAGQANYAAANAFLDALAVHRRGLGLPAVSIAWGLWSLPTSMTAALSSTDSARLSGGGLAALTPERGLDLFDAALRETGALIAADLDLAGLSASGGETPAVLRGLVRAPRAAASAPAGAPGNAQVAGATPAGGLPDRLAALDRGEAQTMVLDLVRAQVAAALGHSRADEIEVDRPFTELGFDSLTSVELRNRLGSETGLRLPTTLVFNQPTVTLLARHLLSELAPAPPAPHQVLRDAVDRVSAQLERPDVADDDQAQVIAVLQAALLRLHAPSEAAADDGESLAHLGAASDEEIFSYIDKQRD